MQYVALYVCIIRSDNGKNFVGAECELREAIEHLVLMKKQPILPPGLFNNQDSYPCRRWKQVKYLADLFWKPWVREYSPLLQLCQKWTQIKKNLTTGDVVKAATEKALDEERSQTRVNIGAAFEWWRQVGHVRGCL